MREPGAIHKEDWDTRHRCRSGRRLHPGAGDAQHQAAHLRRSTRWSWPSAAAAQRPAATTPSSWAPDRTTPTSLPAWPPVRRAEDVSGHDLRPAAPGRHDALDAAFSALASASAHRGPCRKPQHGSRHPDGSHLRPAGAHRAHFIARGDPAHQGSQATRLAGDLRGRSAPSVPAQKTLCRACRPGRSEVRPRLARRSGRRCAVGKPGCHRLFCHRPRPAHPGGKGLREPAARLSRLGDRAAAAAHRGPRGPTDPWINSSRRCGHQSPPHLRSARAARNLGRSGRGRRVRDPCRRAAHPLRLDSLRGLEGAGPRAASGAARAGSIPRWQA